MRRVLRVIAVLGVGVALGVAIGLLVGDDDSSESESAEPDVRVGADRRLTGEPSPLSLEDLEQYPEGSPERTVMDLFFWGQWGALPNIVEQYTPRVVETVGVSRITGAYAFLRDGLSISLPRVEAIQSESSRKLVTVELLSSEFAPDYESFVLEPDDGGWRIAYDTVLDRGLQGYVAYTKSPGRPEQDPDAISAGEQAAQEYRDIAPAELVE